jgi:hypothetical protein
MMMKLFGTLVTMNQNSGEATKLGQAPPKQFPVYLEGKL